MAEALEACGPAGTSELAAWVRDLAADSLRERQRRLDEVERAPQPASATPRRSRAWLAAPVAGLALAAVAVLAWPRPAPAIPAITISPVVHVDAPPPPAPPPPAPVVAARKPPKPRVDACNPPYVIDSAGVKRFKVECFH